MYWWVWTVVIYAVGVATPWLLVRIADRLGDCWWLLKFGKPFRLK